MEDSSEKLYLEGVSKESGEEMKTGVYWQVLIFVPAKHVSDLADQNANAETSGRRYHKHLGLAKEKRQLAGQIDKEIAKRSTKRTE